MNLLFVSTGWDYVSELRSPTLFIPQVIYDHAEPQWNDIDRENRKNSEENLSQCHSVHQKSHTDWPGHEPGLPRYCINLEVFFKMYLLATSTLHAQMEPAMLCSHPLKLTN
jgi:hypothetical protein